MCDPAGISFVAGSYVLCAYFSLPLHRPHTTVHVLIVMLCRLFVHVNTYSLRLKKNIVLGFRAVSLI